MSTETVTVGDAVACIAMALQNPPDVAEWTRLLRDARDVIERIAADNERLRTEYGEARLLLDSVQAAHFNNLLPEQVFSFLQRTRR